ncbi:MAG: lipopolysaccharide biosynthesis protein [Terriglobales bacterium]
MSSNVNQPVHVLAEVPAAQRQRIFSGMRWTFWLSALGVPFTYGTSVLLARTGPEVIGTYGLLLVYITAVSSLFYVGGDAVVIKFVPELPRQKRFAFLVSYFVVTAGFLLSWMVLAASWPRLLRYVFGEHGGAPLQVLLVCLSPLYVLLSITVAAHKAVLDMRWAHLLMRVLTIGSFLVYAALFVLARPLLATHYTVFVWGIYLGLTALATIFGVWHLARSSEWHCAWRSMGFFLPAKFWTYTLTLEQVSVLSFLINRLDLLLVMNLGGLRTLGKYVAALTLADVIRAANRFFVDTLLPSLTNTFAVGSKAAAAQVFSMNLRLLFVVNLAATAALMLLVDPVLILLGSQYQPLRQLFVLMVLCYGLAAPASIGGTLLTSVGKQQRTFYVYVGQLALFVTLFALLWPKWQLLGAVLASGIAVLVGSILLLVVAVRTVGITISAGRAYLAYFLIGATIGAVAIWGPSLGLAPRTAAWLCGMALFFAAAGYTLDELRQLALCFVPRGLPGGCAAMAPGETKLLRGDDD